MKELLVIFLIIRLFNHLLNIFELTQMLNDGLEIYILKILIILILIQLLLKESIND
jgi:hypothetical protein